MLTSRDQILPVRPENIPEELKRLPRWVPWKAEPKGDGSAELSKVPRCAFDLGRGASHSDPRTWGPFEVAWDMYINGATTGVDGVMIALGDGLAGVDIDGGVDATTGAMTDEAREIVGALNSYTERSVSGTGVRVFTFGAEVKGTRHGACEVYSKQRFLTVTGHHIDGTPRTVEQRDSELETLRTQLRDQRAESRPGRRAGSGGHNVVSRRSPPLASTENISDEQVIDTAKARCRGFADLWDGDTSAYDDDRSRADMALFGALAYILGPGQGERIEAIARQSELVRDKWDRRDYIEGTIERAYEGREEFFDWSLWDRGCMLGRLVPVPLGESDPVRGVGVDLRRHVTLNDVGFAERLAFESRDRVRYVCEWQKWMRWDGKRWQIDDGAAAIREAIQLKDRLWKEFADLGHSQQSAEAIKFLKSLGSAARLNASVSLATTQECIRVALRDLDQHPYLLNVRNGTLDLKTGALHPHNPAELITQLADVEYRPGEGTGLWERFMHDAMSGDEERVRFLQASAGLALSGDVSEQLLCCHYGRGSNGKSTFLTSLRKMLGDYGGDAPPDFLMMKNGDSHPTEIAALYGKRFVTAIECEAGRKLREAFVKLMTGGDPIAARRMREDFWTLYPTWKIHVAFNDPPTLSGTDDGIRRRLKIIPWQENFDGARRDKTLKARLESEECRSEILNWCLRGFQQWLQEGGIPSASAVSEATRDYVTEQDVFGQFISEECVVGAEELVLFRDFMASFMRWQEHNGEHGGGWSAKRVGSELQRRGFERCRPSLPPYGGRVTYRGLTRRQDAGPSFPGSRTI